MSRRFKLVLAYLLSLFVFGCEKPSSVKVVKSPTDSIFLTVESYGGKGPASADDTRLYAHFSQDGAADRKLILEGEYLEISKLYWVKPDELMICLAGGITDTFRNEVTLSIGRSDRKVRSSLRDVCCDSDC